MGRLICIVAFALVPSAVMAAFPREDVDVRVRGFRSRCIVAGSEKELVSLAKNLVSAPRAAGSTDGSVITTITLSDFDCLRFNRYSWGPPDRDVVDKVYVERRDTLREEQPTVARVVRDSQGSSLLVRTGGRVQIAGFGRRPESFTVGTNRCQLLQVAGGQSTEVPGTLQVIVFMSCKRASLTLSEAQKLPPDSGKDDGESVPPVPRCFVSDLVCLCR